MVSKFVLPVGFAVVATGLLCTFVFGGVYAVSLLDDWLQQRAEKRAEAEGRTDV